MRSNITLFLIASSGYVLILDLDAYLQPTRPVRARTVHRSAKAGYLAAIASAPDGETFYTLRTTRLIESWNTNTGERMRVFVDPTAHPYTMRSPAGLLVTRTGDLVIADRVGWVHVFRVNGRYVCSWSALHDATLRGPTYRRYSGVGFASVCQLDDGRLAIPDVKYRGIQLCE